MGNERETGMFESFEGFFVFAQVFGDGFIEVWVKISIISEFIEIEAFDSDFLESLRGFAGDFEVSG